MDAPKSNATAYNESDFDLSVSFQIGFVFPAACCVETQIKLFVQIM